MQNEDKKVMPKAGLLHLLDRTMEKLQLYGSTRQCYNGDVFQGEVS